MSSAKPHIIHLHTYLCTTPCDLTASLAHPLQKVILLNLTPPLIPHRLRQLLPRLPSLPRTLQRPVSTRQIDTLLIHRHFRRQTLRVL